MSEARILARAFAQGGRLLDRARGLETAEWRSAAELGYDRRRRSDYIPSHWLALWAALEPETISEDGVFADLGSGKGRVVIEAARHPFRRVIGVELSAELNECAAANLEANRHRLRCSDVQLVTADVADWRPPDDLTIAYMFNPFGREVFSAAVQRLVDLVDARRVPLRILYVNPKEHARLMATGRVVELAPPSGLRTRLAGLPPGWVRRYELRPGYRPAVAYPRSMSSTR